MDPSKYFKNQGVVITSDTRKRDLVSKIYNACRLDLPLCGTKNKTMPKSKRDKRKSSLSTESRFLSRKNWETGKNNKKTIRRTTLATIWRILAKINSRLSPKLADKHDLLFQNWCAIS